MKVKKYSTLEIDLNNFLFRDMYHNELARRCPVNSDNYINCMRAFDDLLIQFAKQAFKLGQENP